MKLVISILLIGAVLELALGGAPGTPSNPWGCTRVSDIVNGNTGAYIKSVCFIDIHIPQPQQYQYCLNIGLLLYTIESSAEIPSFANYIMTDFGSEWDFYLNARRDGSTWVSDNPTQSLNSAVTPIVEKGGDCLILTAEGAFETLPCTNNYNFVCQFNKYPS